MSWQWDTNFNVRTKNHVIVMQSEESVQPLKDLINSLPDTVPTGKRIEIQIFAKMIEEL